MAYEKQTWSSNQLITAEKLNHIEDGIAGAVSTSDIANNLATTTAGKVLDASQGNALNTEITAIKQHKRKIIFIGDSYGAQANPWVDYAASYMGLSSSDYVNGCVSGTGFIIGGGGEGDNGFLHALEAITSNRESYTDIVCCGGINDARGQQYMSNIKPNIRAFIAYAKTNFPNAEIHIGFIGSALQDSSVIGVKKYYNRMLALEEYISSASPYYMSGIENAIHRSVDYYGSDRFHPSDAGSEYIGLCVANSLLNNSCSVRRRYSCPISRDNTTIQNNNILVEINNDYAHIHIDEGFYATFSTPKSFGRSGDNRIYFTFSSLFFNQQITTEIFIQITRNDVAEIHPCILYFVGDSMFLSLESLVNGSWENISTNYVFINTPIEIIVPTQTIN